ncbi:MAG: HlyD family efflux transporter periplasmic adaptor subunit [Planctomycetaceae bacterium]|nr:HlyD family efflux transporter periplasmic adaptor subunit [Planctomycetaceae bacterium]
MSSQQLPQPLQKQQTNSSALHAVQDIVQLSKQDIVPEEFHSEFLKRVVAALGAVGGVVWSLRENTLSGAFQINLQELAAELRSSENGEQQHSRLVYHLLNGPEQGTLCPPHSGFNDSAGGIIANPTSKQLIFCPVRTELETVGIVEIIQHPDANTDAQRSQLQLLYQVCSLAADYYKSRQLRQFGERQNLWVLLEDFTRSVHQSLNVTETSYTTVNEGRRLIECDRVSIALRSSGGGCKITAVSGQDIVDKRATTVKLLAKLAAAAVRADEKVWYTGSTADFAPQVEKAVENYVDEAHTKMIAVFPLFPQKKKEDENEDDGRKRKSEKPFGALIVEQINDSRVPDGMKSRMEIVASHAGSALGNAMEHNKIFLMPLWKLIGKTTNLFTSGRLPLTLLVLSIILIVVGMLTFFPWNFQMYASGTVEPIDRQKVFSPLDANVKELFVDHRDKVHGPYTKDGVEYRGTTLLELRSPGLDSEGLRLIGEQDEINEEIISLTRQTYDEGKKLTEYDKTQIEGKLAIARIRLKTNRNQQKIHELERSDLFVTAPITGTVVSWDIKQRLNVKRPVSRMQMLMEIADLEGEWQLELAMPEKRMGNIAEWTKRIIEDNSDARLNVEFRMATNPNVRYYGTVREIHGRAEVRTDTGSAASGQSGLNSVLIKVALNKDAMPENLRPGAECSAKIYCGKKPLGYVIFYELIAFVQKNILFRLF